MVTLSCKLLQLTDETKLTLTVTLNPKTKLTLELDVEVAAFYSTRRRKINSHSPLQKS